MHAGFTKWRALTFNFLAATIAIVGAVVALMIGETAGAFTGIMLPIAAGGFIYIAGSDLVPEMQLDSDLEKSVLQMISIGVGVGLMFLLVFLE